MKKIILISLFGLMFSQTELTTRLYDYDISWNNPGQKEQIELSVITGGDLSNSDYAIIHLIGIDIQSITASIWVKKGGYMQESSGEPFFLYDLDEQYGYGFLDSWGDKTIFSDERDRYFYVDFGGSGENHLIGTLKLSVTAEFPIEDTGYIEEGFDFCLVPGNNLVAFPCDNPVSVETAIPELAQAEIEQIIGAGQAATNLNGQFIGSLSNFTPGAGYWFKSSSSMCFNYACAE